MKDLKSLVACFSTFSPGSWKCSKENPACSSLLHRNFLQNANLSPFCPRIPGGTQGRWPSPGIYALQEVLGWRMRLFFILNEQGRRFLSVQSRVSCQKLTFYPLSNTQILFFELGLRWAGLSFSPWEAFSVNPVVLHHFCACGITLQKPHPLLPVPPLTPSSRHPPW